MATELDPTTDLDGITGDITPDSLGTVELTPREIAIARREDPDAVATPATAAEVETEVEHGATEGAAAEVETVTPPVEVPEAWYDERDSQYAKSYGLSDYELSQFSSREEFLKAARLLDRHAATRVAAEPVAKPAEVPAPSVPDVPGPFNKDGSVNKAWCEEQGVDEIQMATIERQAAINAEVARLREDNEWVQAQYADQQTKQYETALHSSIDKLNRPELFGVAFQDGKANRINEVLQANRIEVNRRIAAMAESYAKLNIPIPNLDEFVEQVATTTFKNEIAAIEAKRTATTTRARTTAVANQSKNRRPVASTTAATHRTAPAADQYSTEAILQNPAVSELFRRFEEESGTRI